MGKLVQDHLTAIITIVSFALAGVIGYTTLQNRVSQLESEQVTQADLARLNSEVDERVHLEAMAAFATTVRDQSREIDTLYIKAEGAQESAHKNRADLFEMRGMIKGVCGGIK